MSTPVALLIAAILLAVNAFFVGAEFAVTSSRKSQIDPLVEQGRRGAAAAQYAQEHVSLMLACAQLGITLASTGLGAVAEPAIAHAIEGPLTDWGLPAASAHIVGFTIALLVVVILHIVVGEMIPKNISVTMPDRAVLILAPILVGVARLVRPIIYLMDAFANRIISLFGVTPSSEVAATFTVEEVASIVELSAAEGTLDDDLGLLSGALEFSNSTCAQVMVDRAKLETVPASITPSQLDREVGRTGFSRFPAVDETGRILGYIHFKDTLNATSPEERETAIEPWRIRQMPAVFESAEVEDAMKLMRARGAHMAAVQDEDEQVLGVIFLEDILEELVGEVRDTMQRVRTQGQGR